MVREEGGDGPGGGEDADDEEHEDVVWGEGVVGVVDVDEVGEHAEGGDLDGWVSILGDFRDEAGPAYQCDDFHEAPKGEEHSEKHLERGVVCSMGRMVVGLMRWVMRQRV